MVQSIRVWLLAILSMSVAALPALAGNNRDKSMKKPTLFKRKTSAIALSLLLLASSQTVFAIPYSSTQAVVLKDGTSLDIVMANGPSAPPQQKLAAKSLVSSVQTIGDVKIPGVPAFAWSYGSAATAGAMIGGYYDRTSYPNMYTGPTNGGVMTLTNASWGASDKGGNECPLSATRQGVDGRPTRGHVDDYYVTQGNSGPDPYVVNGWTEHASGECTGDYMKASKWFPNSSAEPIFTENINKDGAAVFIFDGTGAPLTASNLESYGYAKYDAGYGLKLFFESRGYTVSTMYNQYIAPFKTYGFTYAQYKAEIDAGRPVMLHLSGHIVVGIGYNNITDNGIIFHDSWDHNEHTMIWGGIYNTIFTHNAVTIVTPTHTLTYAAGTNGSITGTTPQTVVHGSNGTVVTAVPAANYHFVKWSDNSTSNPRTDSNVTTDLSVTASFAINQHALIVNKTGPGTVTSTPAGIDCGANCSDNYDSSTEITLTAIPTKGAAFIGWSGGGCTGTKECVVMMDDQKEIYAVFKNNFPWAMFLPTLTKGIQ